MGSGDPGNRRPMRFDDNTSDKERELFKKISQLNELRNKYPSLALGDLEILKAEGPLLLLQKSYFGEKIIITINNGSVGQSVESDIQYGKLKNLLTDKIKFINDSKFELNIAPYSYGIYEVI